MATVTMEKGGLYLETPPLTLLTLLAVFAGAATACGVADSGVGARSGAGGGCSAGGSS